MKELAFLNKYFYKYRWRFLIGILFVAAQNYFRVLQPKAIRHALDLVVENIGMYRMYSGFAIQAELFAQLGLILMLFGVIVIVLALIMGVFMYFMRQTIIVMSRLIEFDLRNEIFSHYEKLDLAFYKRNNTGDLMARITEDVNKVRMYLGPAVMYGINLVVLFVMVISAMISVSPELTMYSLLPLPFLSISIYYVSNLINRKSESIQKQLSALNSISQEVYSGIRVIKSYVQEKPMEKFFGKESEDYKERSMELARVEALFHPLMLLLIGMSTIITVYIGGLQVIKGNITPGNIAEFVIYINMLTWPVTAIGWVAAIVQRASASQKRINEFLNTEPVIQNQSGTATSLQGAIKFDDVTFIYPDTGIQALTDVSFELKPGDKMAIIGRTGSGKTTIADLIVRMYDVSKGEVIIDGKNIQEHHLPSLRKQIGYVPQDVFLFSDTVANNISFGIEATEEEVHQYAKYASVYDEILGLSNGFETMVGERGVTLSGGQKQRISIARALIKKPDILILDDCLSAVDTKTEKRILDYFEDELARQTAIMITHRIYALLDFNKIIVLDEGRIVEQGTHEELLKNKGFYFDLFEKQKLEELEIKTG
ncbi:MAG: ABC transporter ATP-binding protein [Bacteroidota bacterium]